MAKSNSLGHTNFSMSDHLSPAMENMMAEEHPASIPVYNALKLLADTDKYNVCEPTKQSIAETIHCNPRTVTRALRYMNKKGIIRIYKVNSHTSYYILNTRAFFSYITVKRSKGIAQKMQFNTPAEICRQDNPQIFKDYEKYLAKSRTRRRSSKLSSYGVIQAYANHHHTIKHHVLTSHEIRLMRNYLKFVVKGLCTSKLYMIVGNYLVDQLPMYPGKTLDITNKDVSNALRGKVGKTTTFKAISHFRASKFLLHLRGQMAISPMLLSNAKRSMLAKIKAEKSEIQKLQAKIRKSKEATRTAYERSKMINKKQLKNRH